jgi:hypothetical protein
MTCQPCRECGFWVTPQDKHCPDCGIVRPQAGAEVVNRLAPLNLVGTILAALFGLILGGMTRLPIVALACAIACALIWRSKGLSARARRWSERAASSLAQDEQVILQRLEALQERGKRLVDVKRRVEAEEPAEHWQQLLTDLARAAGALHRQRERYRAKLWEIALVRWQNVLEALVSGWDRLTHDECDRRLQRLDAARTRGEAMLREWELADLAATPDAQGCIERLRHALESCEPLRQALVAQQAMLAVQGVVPPGDTARPMPSHAAAALSQIERFNGRAVIGAFSSAFAQLEAAYGRLHSDVEIEQQVEQLQKQR